MICMERETVRANVNWYCRLRDVQYGAYESYARRHGLTTKELFVLGIIWFSPDGCSQTEICARMSATKQTVSAIVKKFIGMGYMELTESEQDRRNKTIHLTDEGREYVGRIILPAAEAEVDAMAELSGEEIEQLVALTHKFSLMMKQKFEEADG